MTILSESGAAAMTAVSQPYVISGPKWGASGLAGTPGGTVTWSFASDSFVSRLAFDSPLSAFMPTGFEAEVIRAFTTWSAVADIAFVHVADASHVDIRVGGNVIDGPTVAGAGSSYLGIAHTSFIGSVMDAADIEFDLAENWTLGTNGISIFSVATHEIGHAIGLGHTGVANAIMHASSQNLQTLQPDDIAAVQFVYGAADDLPASPATTGAVTVVAPAEGRIERVGDEDWFAVELAAGRPYVIHVVGGSSGSGSLSDPAIALHATDGSVVAQGGASGIFEAAVSFTTSARGTFFIAADSAGGNQTGAYQVSLAFDVPTVEGAVYRFYDTHTGAHFYTAGQDERDAVLSGLDHFDFEGIAFESARSDPPSKADVWRFFNDQTGTHFYTISDAERDAVVAGLPNYHFEGSAYHAYAAAEPGATALYRFYNTDTGTHFYTTSAAERDVVAATLPQYNFEGTAFYVEGLA